MQGLGTPDTEAGQEVTAIVDDMSASVQTTVDDLRDTLGDSSSLQDLLAAVPQATAQLGGLQAELQSSLTELENVDTGELKSELESNEDCAAAQLRLLGGLATRRRRARRPPTAASGCGSARSSPPAAPARPRA